MIFYSDEIVNKIIDTADVTTMIDEIQQFIHNVRYVITRYSIHSISPKYSNAAISDSNNVIAFYCFDTEFELTNCPSMMIYHRYYDTTTQEITYYVLFTCTKSGYRNMGYASKLFDGLKERIAKESTTKNKGRRAKMVLSSVETAVLFYENYGFRWTRESLDKHPVLMQYETYDPSKEYFIMEYYL